MGNLTCAGATSGLCRAGTLAAVSLQSTLPMPPPSPRPSPHALAHELAGRHDSIRQELLRLAGAFQAVLGGVAGRSAGDLPGVYDVFAEIHRRALLHIGAAPGELAQSAVDGAPTAGDARALLGLLERMRKTSRGYAPPEDASAAHRDLYHGLAALEHELTLCLRIEEALRLMAARPDDR